MIESDPPASAEQDQWMEICAAVRAGLAKQVAYIVAMNPSEVADLVRAIDLAIVVEATAGSYDTLVEERRKNLERSSLFGE